MSIENAQVEKPKFGLSSLVSRLVITTKRGSMGFGMNRILISDMAAPEVWVQKIHEVISKSSMPDQIDEEPNVIVQKEVVKVPCRYCGALLDPIRDNACPKCGAPALKG